MDISFPLNENLNTLATKIIAVLVLYKSNLIDSKTYISLNSSIESLALDESIDLVVYDNSPHAMLSDADIKLSENWSIHYIHDPENPGVSKAYNVGAQIGQKLKKDWILLLDQDTNFPADAIRNYCSAIVSNPKSEVYAPILCQEKNNICLSPSGYSLKRGFPIKFPKKYGVQSLDGKTLLSSGLLISLNTFSKLDGYNINLKLDFSDFYFIDKLREFSNEFFLLNIRCYHGLSRSEETDKRGSVSRFMIYCDAKNYFANNIMEYWIICFYATIRAMKLSMNYKSLVFFVILFKSIFKK